MIDTIRSVLSRTVSSRGFIPTMQASANPGQYCDLVTAARGKLKGAMRDCDAAAAALAESESALERVRQLITAADGADAALQTAEENSANFTQRWVESGARTDAPSVDTKLQAIAGSAAVKAAAARIAAAGAEAGLQAANGALWEAKSAQESAQEKVGYSVAELLASMVEEPFAKAQQAAAVIDEASYEIQACAKALAGHFHKFSSDSVAAQLLSRLQATMPAAPRPNIGQLIQRGDDLVARSKEFVELGRRLMLDSDAV